MGPDSDSNLLANLVLIVPYFVTPIIAYLKGRNVLLWMLFGFAGSIFALIAVLFVEKQKRCPMCNERISAKAKICKHCRSLQQ